MPADLIKSVLLPAALILLMVGMGMSLTTADFKRVLLSPKATLVGVLMQIVGLPVLAFALIYALRLPNELAVGLMLVAACPGGPTSNIITHLSKGDTALSVTLTAISSIITVFTIPLVVGASMVHFLQGEASVPLPFVKTLLQLITVAILPIVIGMGIFRFFPKFSQRMAKPINVMSLLFLILIIVLAILKEKNLGEQIAAAGPAVVALNLSGMVLGFLVAAWFKLPTAQRITISIEIGIQNGTLALAIALGLLGSARLAVPAVVYSLFMFISGAMMIWIFGFRKTTTR